ncbi:DUF4345 domain-containing protein [Poseidonocella sedimentorum]|uniref:DUF4345 domain-containing protein n=1 Tax=Poseidonocella sedimentorum TaxID=871652 RepID=A0A1I6CYJ3_9RHOB|nr:DUF4345 domain-containing protein [Poseidonocella sedimentorum]SFQ98298.1 protein of unknown function [Poseidonocella sedimentorum]
MTLAHLQKIALGIAGLSALGIGMAITFTPQTFYASYGIALGSDPSLLSELRAPGAGLTALGAIMLAGLVRQSLSEVAVVAALVVFLGFPAGRIVGLVFDGIPSAGIIAALVFEVAVAALCLFAFRPGRALLQKSDCDRTSPFPGQTYPTGTVTGMPREV